MNEYFLNFFPLIDLILRYAIINAILKEVYYSMNICLIVSNLFPIPATKGGAVETLVHNLLDENEIHQQVHFTCVSIFEEKAYELSKNYCYTDFIYIKDTGKSAITDSSFTSIDPNFLTYMDKVYEELKDKTFDYIVIEGGNWIAYEYLINKLPNQKFLFHIHGVMQGDALSNKIYKAFISVSQYSANSFSENGFVPADKIKVVTNGIKLDHFMKTLSEEEKRSLRSNYHIEPDDTVIMFCGRTIPEKGIKELLLAFKQMQNLEHCKLFIVGNSNFGNQVQTDYDRELVELSKDISDKIIFTGFIHNTELYKIHNISDISVIPSVWQEASGLVVMESLASGLPIIATDSGGIPELVNKDCAILVHNDNKTIVNDLREALDYLYEHPEIRKEMSKCEKIQATKFGTEAFYTNFVNTLQNLSI